MPSVAVLFHGVPARILFIIWPQLFERSPDIAVVCVSVSVKHKPIDPVINLVCLLGSGRPADCKSVHIHLFFIVVVKLHL